MIVSYKLLKEYIDLDGLSLKEMLDKLTLAGFELEGYKQMAQATNLVIGHVNTCVNHPDSDHLHVCEVNTGKDVRQIVCGAPNVGAGQNVIVSLPGAVLPAKGIEIKEGVIRGVASCGMICSLVELGVDESILTDEQKSGIEVLPADAPVGETNVLEYLGLDDTIIDFSVTPNRADVFGLYHFIIEVAAILNRKIIKNDVYDVNRVGESKYESGSETANCNYFSMTTIEGVTIKESPKWMQDVLKKHDIKVINNIVDIGNYVTLMTGQPLHMYDAGSVKTNKFIVKDTLITKCVALDAKEYEIGAGDLVVTNGDEIGCIAGVIGSQSTMINDNTTTIALEAALFDGTAIMNSCKKYGILTVAATNYSKNAVDKYNVIKASDMACSLLVAYADAKKVSKAYEYDARDLTRKVITIDLAFINNRLGTNYDTSIVCDVFNRLAFEYQLDGETYTVTVPTYRNDIEIKEDLVEEVVRLVGFDTVPYTLTTVQAKETGLNAKQKARKIINNYLLDLGLTNTLSYTLINKADADYYGGFDNNTYIALPHPLTVEKSLLRKNLMGSMLKTIFYNQARGIEDVAIYELSEVYTNENLNGREKLAIAISNTFNETKWCENKKVNYYQMKGIVEGLLAIFGIEPNRYNFAEINKYYKGQHIFHPGKSAVLIINGKEVGILGEIHPTTLKKEDISSTIYFEMDFDTFLEIKTGKVKYSPVSKYPSMTRDIALLVKDDVTSAMLIKTIKKTGGSLLSSVDVFDVYKGEHIAKGFKSIAFTMTFTDPTKTLVDATVNELFNKIYAACQKEYNAVIRE